MFRSSVTYADGALYTSSERGQETGYCFKVGFNPDTGQFLDSGWATSIGFSTSTPVVYNGRVYVGHGEHEVDYSCSFNPKPRKNLVDF